MFNGPSDIGVGKVKQVCHLGSETADVQVNIKEDCRNVSGIKEVFDVIVGGKQFVYSALQLGVDCGRFFV